MRIAVRLRFRELATDAAGEHKPNLSALLGPGCRRAGAEPSQSGVNTSMGRGNMGRPTELGLLGSRSPDIRSFPVEISVDPGAQREIARARGHAIARHSIKLDTRMCNTNRGNV